MLSQIQALPKGEMKESLLESFLKTMMKTTQNPSQEKIEETSSGKKPKFVDTSFDRNMKSFIIHNINEKLQPLTFNDLGK